LFSPFGFLPGWSARFLKQVKITDRAFSGSSSSSDNDDNFPKKNTSSTLFLEDLNPEEVKSNILWNVLQDTARRNPLYSNLTAFTKLKILPTNPTISAKELASKLSISLGEALVLLADLKERK
jgi:hypothetical protein